MIWAVLLASGGSRRFGEENKLLWPVEGVPMAERVFRALPPEMPGLVVTGWGPVAALAEKYDNLTVVPNPDGDRDVAVTIRRGIAALPEEAEGALFCVCDQPRLTRESVTRMAEAFRREPEGIHVLSWEGRLGNPCLFPRKYFPALAALPPHTGGKALFRRFPAAVRPVPAGFPGELEDIDRKP